MSDVDVSKENVDRSSSLSGTQLLGIGSAT